MILFDLEHVKLGVAVVKPARERRNEPSGPAFHSGSLGTTLERAVLVAAGTARASCLGPAICGAQEISAGLITGALRVDRKC